jgi:dTDP-4-amino-4,6-dideoxygalactose transaminase
LTIVENRAVLVIHRPSISQAEIDAVARVCESGWFGMGEVTAEFERRVGALVGARHAVGMQSGTAAIHLALLAVGVGPGDEVVVPSFTFAASPQAVLMTGATPVFCEVDEETLTIDVADALSRVTSSTRAVMPVDYAGVACDYDALVPAAHELGIAVVADSAHAFGSSYRGQPLGAIADATCFSFDASKNVTCGDGGIVTTNDDAIAARLAQMRNLGILQHSWNRRASSRPWEYDVVSPGFRYRLGNMNAAIGLVQLDRMDGFRERKRAIVRRYDDALCGVSGIVLPERRLDETFPFLYPIRVLDGHRERLFDGLAERGIQGWVHFIPNHLQPAFADSRTSLPVTERLYGEIASLPLYADMSDEQVELVVSSVLATLDASLLPG